MGPSTKYENASSNKSAIKILEKYKEKQAFVDFLPHNLRSFQAKDNDVFIATFRKSGTTLLQQIVYQLKVVTGAVPSDPTGTDFDDIGEVIPFVEAINLHGVAKPKHEYSPRIWKSHASATDFISVPNTAKFIVTLRDGLSIAPSLLDYYLEWALGYEVRDPQIRKEFYEAWFMTRFLNHKQCGSSPQATSKDLSICYYFKWVNSWIVAAEKDQKNILFLPYEEIIHDLNKAIETIAQFLDVTATKDQLNEVLKRCDRKAMSKDPRFKDRLMARSLKREEFGGRRVRMPGELSFKSIQLPIKCHSAYNQMFKNILGFENYADLIAYAKTLNSI